MPTRCDRLFDLEGHDECQVSAEPTGDAALFALGWHTWWLGGEGDAHDTQLWYCPDCWAAQKRGEWKLP